MSGPNPATTEWVPLWNTTPLVSGPITILGNQAGVQTAAGAAILATIALPLIPRGDVLLVSAYAAQSGGSAPIVLTISVYPTPGGVVDLVTLTGTTGAGDLGPNLAGIWRVSVTSVPPSNSTQVLGDGAITTGTTQARGFPFSKLAAHDMTTTTGTLALVNQSGIAGGGTLNWSWAVHRLKAT